MVEQICEKCGARYSMYAPACPKCGEPSAQPPKKPGCPQAPAPAPAPAPKPKPDPKSAAPDKSVDASAEAAPKPEVSVTVATDGGCPCKKLIASPLALIGALAAVFGIFKLIRK